MPAISVIIPSHDRRNQLLETLDSLAAVTMPPGAEIEAVVIANACSDGTGGAVAARAPSFPFPLSCVDEPRPGLNFARNRGVSAATGDVLAFLDDDVWLDRGWLAALVDVFASESVAIAAGRVLLKLEEPPPAPPTALVERLLSKVDHGDSIVELASSARVAGANLAFRRAVFQRLGSFLPLDRQGRTLLSGGDTELVNRASAAGFRVFYAPRMSVLHRIPPGRLSLEYLSRLARGRGRTKAALARIDGRPSRATLVGAGARQIAAGAVRELRGRAGGHSTDRIDGRLTWMRGVGLLSGLWWAGSSQVSTLRPTAAS